VLEDLESEVAGAGADVMIGALPTVNGDAVQMRQLMQNLLSNAVKFRRDGVAHRVVIDAKVTDGVAEIAVSDNGIGFDPRYSRRIFRVFERLHARTAYPGTGIGLALCRKIVERHGGTIIGEGVPEIGATFRIRLPVDQREEVLVTSVHYDEHGTSAPGEPLVIA
jgi:light-regulated signal transduction histidine kinase (bacteriophytochrome)